MSDISSVVLLRWWDDWQLRIVVLVSLGLQWFLLLAVPMRKYSIRRIFRTCIWLAYISSDPLAIYALATLFNRHVRICNCGGPGTESNQQSRVLEVLWAPILLIHLGGQEEISCYEIEDTGLWMRHTVTLVSQVAVALYAFCKSWHSSGDRKLLAVAVLLFVLGVISFSEKPWALSRAKAKRLAALSAFSQKRKKPSRWGKRLNRFFLFEESSCFSGGMLPSHSSMGWQEEGSSNQQKPVAGLLTEADKVLMVLSDMSLLAAAKELVTLHRARNLEEVLPPMPIAEKTVPRLLRNAFAFNYTRELV